MDTVKRNGIHISIQRICYVNNKQYPFEIYMKGIFAIFATN